MKKITFVYKFLFFVFICIGAFLILRSAYGVAAPTFVIGKYNPSGIWVNDASFVEDESIYLKINGLPANTDVYFAWTNSTGDTWYVDSNVGTTLSVTAGSPIVFRTDSFGNVTAGPFPWLDTISCAVEDDSHFITGTQYRIKVKIGTAGTWSSLETYSVSCPEPPGPLILDEPAVSCQATGGRVGLSWSRSTGASKYYIYRCSGSTCDPKSELYPNSIAVFLSDTDSGLANGVYRYSVRPLSTTWTLFGDYSNVVTANVSCVVSTPTPPPTTPTPPPTTPTPPPTTPTPPPVTPTPPPVTPTPPPPGSETCYYGACATEYEVQCIDSTSLKTCSWQDENPSDGTSALCWGPPNYCPADYTCSAGACIYSPSAPIGSHDSTDCSFISGWTCDFDDYSQALGVDIYANAPKGMSGTTQIGSNISANQPWGAGVAASCGGYSNHGFSFTTPSSLKDGQNHSIYVYAKNILSGADILLPKYPTNTGVLNCPNTTPGGIFGYVWEDSDSDGVLDATEKKVRDPSISCNDANTISQAVTISGTGAGGVGNFSAVKPTVCFLGAPAINTGNVISPGTYTLDVAPPSGWEWTNTSVSPVTIPAGGTASLNIGVRNAAPGGIKVRRFYGPDILQSNATIDAMPIAIDGTTITPQPANPMLAAISEPSGIHRVSISAPAGWIVQYCMGSACDNSANWAVGSFVDVNVPAATTKTVRFYLTPPPPTGGTCDRTFNHGSKYHVCYYQYDPAVVPPNSSFSAAQNQYLLAQVDDTPNPLPAGGAYSETNPVLDHQWLHDPTNPSREVIGSSGRTDFVRAAWRGQINFAPGTYIFHVNSDDGVYLYVDDITVPKISSWKNQDSVSFATQPITFSTQTTHNILIKWYDHRGNAVLKFWWDFIPAPAADAVCAAPNVWDNPQYLGVASITPTGAVVETSPIDNDRLIIVRTGFFTDVQALEWKDGSILADWYQINNGFSTGQPKLVKQNGQLLLYILGNDGYIHKSTYQSQGSWSPWVNTDVANSNFGQAGPTARATASQGTYQVAGILPQQVAVTKCVPPLLTCNTTFPRNRFRACYFNSTYPGSDASQPPDDPTSVANVISQNREAVFDPSLISASSPAINHVWDLAPQGSYVDNTGKKTDVSAAWRGKINFPLGGYALHVQSDDGFKLYIRNKDTWSLDWVPLARTGTADTTSWKTQSPAVEYDNAQAPMVLSGDTDVMLLWFQKSGNATAKFWWDKVAVCGDGFENQASEQCDDGNLVDTDLCKNDCTIPVGGFDYDLTVSDDITVTQGSTGSNTITRTLVSGTTRAVNLSVQGLPQDATVETIGRQDCSPTCDGVLVLKAAAITPVGDYTINVLDDSLGKNTSFVFHVTQAPPPGTFDYSLTSDGNIPVSPGSSGSNTIILNLNSGTTQDVVLSVSVQDNPAFVHPSFSNSLCSPDCNSVLTFDVDGTAPERSYLVTVTGTSAGVSDKFTTFNLNITTSPQLLCGNNTIDTGEQCDGTSDLGCLGQCIDPPDPNACQCSGVVPNDLQLNHRYRGGATPSHSAHSGLYDLNYVPGTYNGTELYLSPLDQVAFTNKVTVSVDWVKSDSDADGSPDPGALDIKDKFLFVFDDENLSSGIFKNNAGNMIFSAASQGAPVGWYVVNLKTQIYGSIIAPGNTIMLQVSKAGGAGEK